LKPGATVSVDAWFYGLQRLCGVVPTAEAYLRAHAGRFPWGELFARHGHAFNAPNVDDCVRVLCTDTLLPAGQCYVNALGVCRAAIRRNPLLRRSVRYAEGLAVHPTGAYPHAWCVIGDDVCDPTWPDGCFATYFGVPFDPIWIEHLFRRVDRIGMTDVYWSQFASSIETYLAQRTTADH
jgi:hypothetical protein